ncbi:MAG: XF1762 family protein [Acidobacteriaceae bacterium]
MIAGGSLCDGNCTPLPRLFTAWKTGVVLRRHWACREIKKRGYKRAITYTKETESGVSLRAASFRPVHRSKGGTWNRPSRHRVSRRPNPPKIRWERVLSPKAVALPELNLQHTLPLAA